MAPIFGYWNIRGLGEHIRYLLAYTETEYVDKVYDLGKDSWNKTEWMSEKFKLGLDFPNLPYYIDGPHKITQSNAILRHIARKHGLIAKTEEETIKADILENEAMDLRMGFARICYDKDFEKLKGPYIADTMNLKLEQLSKSLCDNDWFLGDHISYVDFFIYEAVDALRQLVPTCLAKLENLHKFMVRFESLDSIKKHRNGEKFKKYPISAPQAYFGGKIEGGSV